MSNEMTIENYDIKKAAIKEYLTLSEKRYLILKGMETIFENTDGIFVCDGFMKDEFLTMVLIGTYFGCTFTKLEKGNDVISLFQESDYDLIHQKNLLGLIERTKHQKNSMGQPTELSFKVRRATEDFALFTKLFNTAINNELSVRNNLIDRLVDTMTKDLSPEQIKSAQADLLTLNKQLENNKVQEMSD